MSDNLATPENQIIISPTSQAEISHEPARTGRLTRRTIFDLTQLEFERLQFMAKIYAASTFNAKNAQSEGDFFLIMLKGLELGISPMAAVDTINIISGKPVLDAKGMLALVKSSGLLEDIQIDSNNQRCIVTVKRFGNSEQIVSFTLEDAQRFQTYERGSWIPLANKGNWKSQPTVMLKWRAVTSAMREVFPDVISGLYTPEELDPDTIVNDDGSMEIVHAPALPESDKIKQFPESGKIDSAKPADEPKPAATTKAWHEDPKNLIALLGNCVAKGWIEGANLGEQKASFLSLVGKEVTAFETGKAANDAAEEAATKQGAKPAEAWDTLDGINKVVEWAKEHGYGHNEPELLRLLGVPDWKAFDSGREACEAIKAAAGQKSADEPAKPLTNGLSAADLQSLYDWVQEHFALSPENLADKVDLSKFSTLDTAQKMIRAKASEERWNLVSEKATYVVKQSGDEKQRKYISFKTLLGEVHWYKGRTEFSKLIGDTFAEYLVENSTEEVEPLLLTWKQHENYREVLDAIIVVEPELA